MVEFPQEFRHYCRNPKCSMKLPKPVESERDAFCTKGCYRQFYRFRCLICEEPMERKTETQLICGKRRCRNALEKHEPSRRGRIASPPIERSKKVVKPATFKGPERGIAWAIRVNSCRIIGPGYVLAREFK